MVFQSYALYPHMTVRENLEFGLRIRKLPQAEIDALVSETAQMLDIGHLLDRKPRELSGGQRQRVAVGRAIVRKPAVFLFDEPLSNLDAKLRVQMRAEISKLQQRLQTTTIYVTHDQVEAMTMGHRVAVLKDGDLMQVGTPLELYERPANVFVGGFLGTPPMNFIRATVTDDGARLVTAQYELPVPASLRGATGGQGGRGVVVGLRPENLLSGGKPPRGEHVRLSAEAEIVEPLGHEVIVHARVGGDLLVTAVDRTTRRRSAIASTWSWSWTRCTCSTPRPSCASGREPTVPATPAPGPRSGPRRWAGGSRSRGASATMTPDEVRARGRRPAAPDQPAGSLGDRRPRPGSLPLRRLARRGRRELVAGAAAQPARAGVLTVRVDLVVRRQRAADLAGLTARRRPAAARRPGGAAAAAGRCRRV
jgi:ABC-type sugar transport system ATPase subunit